MSAATAITLLNCTFNTNRASGGRGGPGNFDEVEHAGNGGAARGGAIYDGVTNASSRFINLTIAGNSAVGGAGGENGGGATGSSFGGGIWSNASPAL